jgi:acetyltransferase-like isoleucine patch superfamily enzyme
VIGWLYDQFSRRVWDARTRWRRARVGQLCAQGLQLGKNVVIMHNVEFDAAYPWLIEVGDGCRISAGVRVLAHDATPFKDLGVARLGRVRILRDSFIGERSIILPGVTIGPRAMIAAGSVVGRDVGDGVLVAGNPARVYGQYDEYLARVRTEASAATIVTMDELAAQDSRRDAVRAALARGEPVYVRGSAHDITFDYNVTETEIVNNAREAFRREFG